MEFAFRIRDFLNNEIAHLTPDLLNKPPFTHGNVNTTWNNIRELIDTMGEYSAHAQNLPHVVTNFKKFSASDHNLYVLSDVNLNRVIGFLKTGKKRLFMHDSQGLCTEAEPLCVLDFYIHESCQRKGHGKRLFDYMLQVENVAPPSLAIDSPSRKMLHFLSRHYHLDRPIFSSNNFVIYPGFFSFSNNIRKVYQDFRTVYSTNDRKTVLPYGDRSSPRKSRSSQLVRTVDNRVQPHHSTPHTEITVRSAMELTSPSQAKTDWKPSSLAHTNEQSITSTNPRNKTSKSIDSDCKNPEKSSKDDVDKNPSGHFPCIDTKARENYSVISSQELRLLRGLPDGRRTSHEYSYLNAVRNHNGHRKLW
ncbi:hypothetical protein T265_11140 [Opisthorchis viverrini]|uniref:Alpha-tubulin N-acetyltransferase n=1 Tax=Opisthorchis viverrini TaxID=6198 RepID=A0A074Z035_OPIVI|nr:hypothetical protein T265_11140 [Opisthorchis viverrini]KER20278.1 hypothetical protein T265_11140 [Opisthorchis viverrini]